MGREDGAAWVRDDLDGAAGDPEALGAEVAAAAARGGRGRGPRARRGHGRVSGRAFLVGGGPGDPGLLTLRAVEVLREADVILFDRLAPAEALAYAPAGAELVDVGKVGGGEQVPQEETVRLLVDHVRAGRRVVRLKGGDPFVFGRGGEEAQALRAAGLPFEVVPGVTAGVAAPAYAGIPVTQRGLASAVAFVTGHEDPGKEGAAIDWPALAAFPGTLVFYMGVRRLPRIAEQLVAAGRSPDEPAAVVQQGTLPGQRTVLATLATIADAATDAAIQPPSITVVGPVAALHAELDWLGDGRPLGGVTVAVTRARRPGQRPGGPAARARRRRRRGTVDPHRAARPAAARPRRLRPRLRDEPQRGRAAAGRGARRPGAGRGARRGDRAGDGPRAARPRRRRRRRPGAVGGRVARRGAGRARRPAGARGGGRRRRATCCPAPCATAGRRSTSSRSTGPSARRSTTTCGPRRWARTTSTFASGSAVRFFAEAAGTLDGPRLVSIGPVTSDALRALGREPDVEASEHTPDGLVAALLADAAGRR